MKNLFIIAMLLITTATLSAQDPKFEAMAIYNFTRTLQWADDMQKGNFVISVLDDGELYNELVVFTEGKKVRGEQKIVVEKHSNISSAAKSHIIVIPKSESDKLEKVVESSVDARCLIITEQSNLLDKGAGVCFVTDSEGVTQYQFRAVNIESRKISVSTAFRQIGLEL